MTAATILKNTRRQAVVKAVSPGSAGGIVHCNLISLVSTVNSNATTTTTQTISGASELTISDVLFSVTGNTNITRSASFVDDTTRPVILTLTEGQHSFQFSQGYGFVLNERANANIQINFGPGANGSVILCLTKGPGFDEPNLQNLQDFQRP
jgi:hypothetical protein